MTETFVNYNGEKIKVGEPTIKIWKKVASLKDIVDEKILALALVSASTGLKEEDLNNADWYEIYEVSNFLMEKYEELTDKFYPSFEFEGKTYKFINLDKLTFGQFIDLDSYHGKAELEKIDQLNYYMSMLYVGEDEDPTDTDLRKERAKLFDNLPIKYYLGAHSFFLSSNKIFRKGMMGYLVLAKWKLLRTMIALDQALVNFGVGMVQYLSWPVTTLRRLIQSRVNR